MPCPTLDLDRPAGRPAPLVDPFARAITYLRVSVTDRCDFRCVYCMSEHMSFLPKADLLTLEELDRLCSAFVAKGVRKLRLTGGEPLVRRGIMTLFSSLSRHLQDRRARRTDADHQRLAARANTPPSSKGYGVERINVSLDTLDPDKFRAITRWGDLGKVLAGIDAAQAAGLKVKINAVALKGVNEDELADLVAWAHGRGMDITIIEVMPLGDIGDDRLGQYLPLSMVRARLAERFTLDDIDYQHRRPGALCARQGDRRPARLHHADDAQLLRILQPRAHHLHRHALHVPRPGGRRRPARAAARLGRQRCCSMRPSTRRSRASRRATTSSSTAATSARRCPAT